jgi:superfamily II DNA or RNA helicase
MLKKSNLYDYQKKSVKFILKNKSAFMLLGLSLGKTIISLTAIAKLIKKKKVKKVLILAPLRVAQSVWDKELSNWEHLQDLTLTKMLGTPKKRLEALNSDSDIYITNIENTLWLLKQKEVSKFDMLIIDESSTFKSYKSARFKALKKLIDLDQFKRKVLLTGTPASKDIQDLFPQLYILDKGERLGRFITHFRNRYMNENRYGFGYTEKKDSRKKIFKKIQDVTLSLRTEDLLDLPQKVYNILETVTLQGDLLKQYKVFEKEFILEYGEDIDDSIVASTKVALNMKLAQFCSGAIYKDTNINTDYEVFHELKLDVLDEILEQHEGENILLAYNFKHELDRILKRYPQAVAFNDKSVDNWNSGKIKILCIHPASASHGINLQHGGRILVWLSPTYDLERHLQLEGRISRIGQKHTTLYYNIVLGGIEREIAKKRNKKDVKQVKLLKKLR